MGVIGFLSSAGPDPNHKATKPDFQCWVVIGSPAKRHFNGVSLAGRIRPAYSGILILFPLINGVRPLRQNFVDPRMHFVAFCSIVLILIITTIEIARNV